MVDPTTVNKFLNQPVSGSDVGVWDVPVNANMSIVDNSFGGLATIALGGSPVALSSTQYQCAFLRFTGALTANVAVTFPAVGSFYTIINDATNSSAFVVTAGTTVAGSRAIGLPPGTMTEIMTDGSNARFRSLPPVGTYFDMATSSTPLWIDSCTVPPYLNCLGTSFSSATYPTLAVLLGGTTLPDSRAKTRIPLAQGSTVVSSGISGILVNTIGATGGSQSVTLTTSMIPSGIISNIQVNGNQFAGAGLINTTTAGSGSNCAVMAATNVGEVAAQGVNISGIGNATFTDNAGNGISPNMPPVYVGGITLIRAG